MLLLFDHLQQSAAIVQSREVHVFRQAQMGRLKHRRADMLVRALFMIDAMRTGAVTWAVVRRLEQPRIAMMAELPGELTRDDSSGVVNVIEREHGSGGQTIVLWQHHPGHGTD
jgi:hypothetical protein